MVEKLKIYIGNLGFRPGAEGLRLLWRTHVKPLELLDLTLKEPSPATLQVLNLNPELQKHVSL